MALDRANNRLFIGHHGNSRYDIYQLDEQGLPLRRHADKGVGRSLIGRGFAFAPLGKKELNFPMNGGFDSVHQRLFTQDNSSLGHPGFRIMVFDLSPESLAKLAPGELPEATHVLGQPHFDTWTPGSGPAGIGGRGQALVDEERQLLFFNDAANNRVLVWDIEPSQFRSGMEAIAVIGQTDFYSRESGIGRSGLTRPGGLDYDPVRKHLYVMDGNRRVMVFDVSDRELDRKTGFEAFAVIGQDDFTSNAPPQSSRKLHPGVIGLDYKYHRLFVGEQFGNRFLVFDVSPEKLQGAYNPDAIAVVGQPDFEETDPAVTQTRLTMPRITIDSERQLAYAPDGYPAGNRINIFDIHPERMKQFETPMLDQIGHINPEGEPDFLARSANDRVSPRFWTQGRDVSVDTVDHRLFMSDNYGHRVMVFRLDRLNRLLDREAAWVLGQPDPHTSQLLPGRDARSIKLPLAVEYDESHKRLFVADTWNDRVLVFDMSPGQVASGMAASWVLGQKDFTSYEPAAAQDRVYFGSRAGRGIYTTEARAAELAIDKVNQRLFVTDGGNHRVLVFDVHPARIANGAKALHVIGQDDFSSKETGLSASRWELPGDLVLDEARQRLFVGVAWQHRVLVFDVHPERLKNSPAAIQVIGQPDFVSGEPGLSKQKFRQTDGLSYDPATDRLYVTDKYNHRVLVFDVHPERFGNLPEAVAVIGERDFEAVRMGPGDPRNYPDRLYDPRGSYFDAADKRLYQSEGLNGRLTVFTLPREQYKVDLPGRSSLSYASLDAQLSTGPEPATSGYARAAGKTLGLSTHRWTRAVMHPQSERQSRELLSAAMLSVGKAVRRGMVYVDTRDGRETVVSVVNPGGRAARLNLALQAIDGKRLTASRTLAAGEQFSSGVEALFAGSPAVRGVMTVSSNQPVVMTGLLGVSGGDGVMRSAPAPVVRGAGEVTGLLAERRVLPAVPVGAGRDVSIVLLNPSSEPVRGQMALPGRGPVAYELAAGGVMVHALAADGGPLLTGHGVVRASAGPAPHAFAVVSGVDRDGVVQSVHTVSSGQEGTVFWGPVETYADVLHHGDIDLELSVMNEGLVPATVYLELFGLDGASEGKYERTVPLGEHVALDLEEVFGRSPLRGMVRVFSDSEVSVAMLESTKTVLGARVEMDVPLQGTPEEAVSEVVYPVYRNGAGQATELILLNTDRRGYEGTLAVHAADGTAQRVILR